MRLDGRFADEQLLSDLGVREAAGNQSKDVLFALAQLAELLRWGRAWDRAGRDAVACALLERGNAEPAGCGFTASLAER